MHLSRRYLKMGQFQDGWEHCGCPPLFLSSIFFALWQLKNTVCYQFDMRYALVHPQIYKPIKLERYFFSCYARTAKTDSFIHRSKWSRSNFISNNYVATLDPVPWIHCADTTCSTRTDCHLNFWKAISIYILFLHESWTTLQRSCALLGPKRRAPPVRKATNRRRGENFGDN